MVRNPQMAHRRNIGVREMAENKRGDHWSERRQRRTRCKIHGLHYDPDLTSGCALCRKEGLTQAEARRSRPQLVVLLLALLGVALSAYRMFGPGTGALGLRAVENEPTQLVERVESSRLDPTAYRRAIEAVDRALLSPTGEDVPTIGRTADAALDSLARVLRDANAAKERAAAAEIADWREDRDSWVTSGAITQLRQRWLTWRGRVFERASWFRRDAAGAGLERLEVAAYHDAVSDLMALLEEGAARARDLASTVTPYATSDESQERIRTEWSSFSADWRQRLEDLARSLPERPRSNADAGLLIATQRLEAALALARSVAADAGLPLRATPEAAFDRAFDLAEEARRSFEEMSSS